MVTKKLFYLFCILLSMVGTKALAYDIAVENTDGVTIYYNYINDGKELEVTSRGSKGSYFGSVVIPEEVTYMKKTLKVTSIGGRAFYECSSLISISIPNSVTSIGFMAFNKCSDLTSVTIGNSVTSIGEDAFAYCSGLTSVTVPNSVTSIGEDAFAYCSGLTSVTIPNSVMSIGGTAFSYCSGLTSIVVENGNTNYDSRNNCNAIIETSSNTLLAGCMNTVIPNSVTSIGEQAFIECSSLTSITIPNSVMSIGFGAFYECSSLISITIPNSVTSIGEYAFYGCDIPEVISKIENPFSINPNIFSDNTFDNATLYVPAGTIEKYKATEGWKKFVFIEEGSPSSISAVDNTGTKEYKRYSLDGKAIKNSHKGINIIQMDNGTTKKVVVK